jgi:hypothetical protein
MATDSQSAEVAATQPVREDLDGPYKAYNLDLKARRAAAGLRSRRACMCTRRAAAARAPVATRATARRAAALCTRDAAARRRDGPAAGARGARHMPAAEPLLVRLAARAALPQAPIFTQVNAHPRMPDHKVEWRRVLAGDPVEVNPSYGNGLKVMTIGEWTALWKVRRRRRVRLSARCAGARRAAPSRLAPARACSRGA